MADSVSWRGQAYELISDDELVLILLAGRLADLRDEWAAAVSDAKGAVREAAASGMSERAIARVLGVHRRTVRSWRVSG